jgi:hypothetical protein
VIGFDNAASAFAEFLQRLKPVLFGSVGGTTEVVP